MKNAIKTLVSFIVAASIVIGLALWNAEKVGISSTQFWSFMKLQILWVWGLALVILAIGWISHIIALAVTTKDIAKAREAAAIKEKLVKTYPWAKEAHQKNKTDWDL